MRPRTDLRVRFYALVVLGDGCWLWRGALNGEGYGVIFDPAAPGRSKYRRAHRVSWELHNGHIPDGTYVCHHCDTPSCVRPSHLFIGSAADNMADMRRKGRAAPMPQSCGEFNGRAKITADDVKTIRHLWAAERRTQKEIAAHFNLHQTHISEIVRGIRWPRAVA